MNNLHNDLLLMKVFININNFYKNIYNDNYSNLLLLIKNNMSLYDLNNALKNKKEYNYFLFLNQINMLHNTKIVSGSTFLHTTVDKKKKRKRNFYHTQAKNCNIIEEIKNNPNDLFFIYKVSYNNSRYYKIKDSLLRKNRKNKLSKLSNLS